MNTADALFESSIPELPLLGRGKVRDIYDVDENHLLIVTSDRLSAYDVVLPDPIAVKGKVLTRISLFWFRMMADIIDNQLTDLGVEDVVKEGDETVLALANEVIVSSFPVGESHLLRRPFPVFSIFERRVSSSLE